MQLGSGNALDANTQVGSGRSNTTSAPVDYRARNLVVTGNVAGGRGFRGSVGYTADTDFRGSTGSDDIFSFQADSAYSSVVFNSSSLSRDRFLVAQGLGAFEYRRDSTPSDAPAQRSAPDQTDSRMRLDRANTAMSLGRMNWDVGEDRTVATGTSRGGEPIRYIVSPLRGLQTERLDDPLVKSGLGLYEQARARQEIALGLAKPEDFLPRSQAVDRGMVDAQVKTADTGASARQQSQAFAPGYLEILKSVDTAAEKKTGDKTATTDRVKRDLAERTKPVEKREPGKIDLDKLNAEKEKDAKDKAAKQQSAKERDSATTNAPGTEAPIDPAKPEAGAGQQRGNNDPLLKVTDAEPEREAKREKERGKLLTVDEMADILRHGKTISTLSPDDKRRVDELTRLGESSLKSGEYFTAERRFSQAQDFRTGNPLIEVGMAHAQLGGGMYLSSALTLRNLFKAHPELIDTRYDRALLPGGERLNAAIKLVRERIALGEDRPNYGFLLAYMGHQLGDKQLTEEGLAQVKGSDALDTSGALLRGIWLGSK